MKTLRPSRIVAPVLLCLLPACESPSSSRKAGPPAQLQIAAGGFQTGVVGEELPSPLVVRVNDSQGLPVQGQLINFHVMEGNGTVYAGVANTDADGVAQERWTLGTVAGDTQRVEVRAVNSETGQAILFATFKAVADPGPASALTSVDGDALYGGSGVALAESLTVRLSDQYGNPVPDQTISFAVTSGGGTISPSERITGGGGLARAAWILGANLDEIQTATASFASLPPVTFTATATAAGTLSGLAGDGQAGPVGELLPDSLAVRLTTAAGTPIRGATVEWGGAGTASPPTSVTDADGVAKTSWTLGRTSGPQRLTALVSESSIAASFSADARAVAPDTIHFVSYSPDLREIGSIEAVTVRVVDSFGNPVPEQTVYWETICGGPVSPTSSTTGAQGLATTGWQVSECEEDSGGPKIRVYIPDIAQSVFGMIGPVQTPRSVDLAPDSVAVTTATETVRLRMYLYDEDSNYIQPYEGCRYTCYTAFSWMSTDAEVAEFASFPDADTQAEADFLIKAAGVTRIIVSNGSIADTSVVVVTVATAASQAVLSVADALEGGASPTAYRPIGIRRPEE